MSGILNERSGINYRVTVRFIYDYCKILYVMSLEMGIFFSFSVLFKFLLSFRRMISVVLLKSILFKRYYFKVFLMLGFSFGALLFFSGTISRL